MSDADITEQVASALGHLLMAFNELEIAAGGTLMRLLKQDERVGGVFVAHLAFSAKLTLLEAPNVKLTSTSDQEKLSDLVGEARRMSTERNRLVHASETLVMLMRRLKDATKPDQYNTARELFKHIKIINPEDVIELVNDATSLAMELLSFSEQMN